MFLVTLTFYLGTHKPAWLGKLAVPPGCPHRRCNNCPRYAMRWRAEVLERIAA